MATEPMHRSKLIVKDGENMVGTIYERNGQAEGYFFMQCDVAVFGEDMQEVADEMLKLARDGARRSRDRRPTPQIHGW